MSSTTSATQSGNAAAAQGAHGTGRHHGKGKAGTGDIFSNLMQLLSATRDDNGSTGPMALLGDSGETTAHTKGHGKGKGKGADLLEAADADKAAPMIGSSPSDVARAVMSGWPNVTDGMNPKTTAGSAATGTGAGAGAGAAKVAPTDASEASTASLTSAEGDLPAGLATMDSTLPDAASPHAGHTATAGEPGVDWRAMGMQAVSGQERVALDGNATASHDGNSASALTPDNVEGPSTAGRQPTEALRPAGAPASAGANGGVTRREGEIQLSDDAPRTGAAQAKTAAWRSTTALPNAMPLSANGSSRAERNAAPEGVSLRAEAADIRSTVQLTNGDSRDNASSNGGQGGTASQSPFQLATNPTGDPDIRHEAERPHFSVDAGKTEGNDPTAAGADTGIQDEPGIWSTHNTRQASLRVGEEGEDAIDIQVRMAGQDVSIELRTDNPEIRANLAQHAPQTLQDMMSKSGIQLADVNVGSQSAGSDAQRQAAQQANQDTFGTIRTRSDNLAADGSAAPAPTRAPQRRADGSSPLDLFV